MTILQDARRVIMTQIEDTALYQTLPLYRAAPLVFRHPDNFAYVVDGMGGRYRGRMPTSRQLRAWYHPVKHSYSKEFISQFEIDLQHWKLLPPDVNTQALAHEWISPYLPIPKRIKLTDGDKSRQARAMIDAGRKPVEVSEMFGVSISTIYRWIKRKPHNIYKALELETAGLSKKEIAREMNISLATVYRLLNAK